MPGENTSWKLLNLHRKETAAPVFYKISLEMSGLEGLLKEGSCLAFSNSY